RLHAEALGSGGDYTVAVAGSEAVQVSAARLADGVLSARFNGDAHRFLVHGEPGRLLVHDGTRRLQLEPVEVYRRDSDASAEQDDQLRAPMPGRVVVVRAAQGDKVVAGQELVVVEAMKMELALKAPRDGVVASVSAAAGDFVEADAVLVALER
ncbi:3-methylcrotonyl-CoA carboxylase, partial [Luteimonas sp. 8-5]|uniref:acetyl-CoA carboxylase biotin carboxyl carrier protein subunit n=1 Tax=Luteimonas sp. 8-5 TaxID=3039387 RepID=UPI002A31CD34|nr:3-methylcrotonyl-CoA carboxylase [Luteimonas sp. 8-5]